MPFIPHTDSEIAAMLESIGIQRLESLFDEVPTSLRYKAKPERSGSLTEMHLARLLRARAEQDKPLVNFMGAGAYEHHIPAPVWEIAGRGEFLTAYTPYQAEASQGMLQVLYEFQTMICQLTAMEVANASLYDGASALAEAVLMAIRANRLSNSKVILMPMTVAPNYRRVVKTLVEAQGIELIELPYCTVDGQIIVTSLDRFAIGSFAALVIPQPNFFGSLEEVDLLTNWAHSRGGLVIGLVNPIALGVLSPPGHWGKKGADIVCGEGQPLGVPLSSGGPYFGFMSCRNEHVRQMPGRLVGRTVDREQNPGFVLTLQAREQHIRRSRATSNICTNQGLMTVAATIYLSILGPTGLARVAGACHANMRNLVELATSVPGIELIFQGAFFHEAVLRFPEDPQKLLPKLAQMGILAGYPLGADYPELGDAVLVCATETKTEDDIQEYIDCLVDILGH
ncbi:MAG: aminomethyl-transferring glycine dehydrogenase subunit GcvPA [Magnetococcus sp. DMHC-6]